MEYVVLIILIIILGYLYYLNTPTSKGKTLENIIHKTTKNLAKQLGGLELRDLMFQDDLSTAQIDNLLITSKGLYVIEAKNYNGHIFGSEKQENWTMTVKHVNRKKSKSGAGILQVDDLLRNSDNVLSFTLDSSSNQYLIDDIVIESDDMYMKLKVSAFLLARVENNQQILNNYKLEVYLNDQLIGYSDSVTNNYELVIGNIYETGTLKIVLSRNGQHQGLENDKIGIAWVISND